MSSKQQLEARNQLVDWQVAPAEHEIANYDEHKIKYRQYVEQFIQPLTIKSVKKKTFITIATNVLCAEVQSSKATIDSIDRDIYLPLEIVLTKWSLADAKQPASQRSIKTHHWMVDPGRPPIGCVYIASEHRKLHKIEYVGTNTDQNVYVEKDLEKVMKEINSVLLPDRTVFSLGLKHCRQDLGSLKWLNRETGYKTKPIKVFSLEDLYVVLIRHLKPETKSFIGQGIARHRMVHSSNPYAPENQCKYHQTKALDDDGECACCAKALAEGYTNVLMDDVSMFTDIFQDTVTPTSSNREASPGSVSGH